VDAGVEIPALSVVGLAWRAGAAAPFEGALNLGLTMLECARVTGLVCAAAALELPDVFRLERARVSVAVEISFSREGTVARGVGLRSDCPFAAMDHVPGLAEAVSRRAPGLAEGVSWHEILCGGLEGVGVDLVLTRGWSAMYFMAAAAVVFIASVRRLLWSA
jgi:hypothetical protein